MSCKIVLSIISLSLSLSLIASEEALKVKSQDLLQVAQDLQVERESPRHSAEAKQLMDSVSEQLQVLAVEGDLEEPELEPAPQKKKFFTRVGRALGRSATWLSVQTMKPFVKAGAFITAVVEKKDNNNVVALYNLVLKNSGDLDDLYKEASTPEEFVDLLIISFQEILEKKSNIILKDTLKALDLGIEIPENIADINWAEADFSNLDPAKIDPKLINDHPEFQDLKPLVGEFTREQIADLIIQAQFDPEIDLSQMSAALPNIPELVGAVIAQMIVPQIVLTKISSSLAGIYALPVLASNVGFGVSVAVCLNEKTQQKFEVDEDLRQFCSVATNWSSYEIMKARGKGYVSGKKTKARLKEWNEKRKARRELRRMRRMPSCTNA
jgi:uncharacterized protein YjiS (DUF1127 family)